MKMTYEVTIGIPVYNVEKYIAQTIDSVLCQTFNSIEFLFCDDCGTDTSMDIVGTIKKRILVEKIFTLFVNRIIKV